MASLNALLPIALAIIILSLGLSMTSTDFRRLLEQLAALS